MLDGMRIALTLDDLPIYPHLALAPGHTNRSVASAILSALAAHGLDGIYAFANSWPLDAEAATAAILDDWVAAGHHVANHTHSHPLLTESTVASFVHDIDVADQLLAPWANRAPQRCFRYPLDLWGETEDKRARVRAHLDAAGYHATEVTSWFLEWEWDRAWQWLQAEGRQAEAEALKDQFIDYALAQLAYDRAFCREFFGHDIVGIGLVHNVGFTAEVLEPLLGRMIEAGVVFAPLSEALVDPAYARGGTIVSDRFLVYQQKLSAHDGHEVPMVPPECADLIARVWEWATPLRPARRGQLVVNSRALA